LRAKPTPFIPIYKDVVFWCGGKGETMEFSKFIAPFGIAAFALFTATLLGGIFRMKIANHRMLAALAFIFAVLHVVLIITAR